MMNDLISAFSKQLTEAISIGENAGLTNHTHEIKNVIISGLGGSGIGGTIVSQLTANEATLPISVSKGYFLPSFVNQHTLVIISSYSGNTEETIQTLQEAIEKKSKIVCITSGGKIAEIAGKQKINLITIPGGMPPRACLAYSFTQLFFVLNYFNIIGAGFKKQIINAIKLIDADEDKTKELALEIAKKLVGKIPVIYTTTYKEGIAVRLRQQINENAKMLCWHHVVPEMNHNELVGWREKNDSLAVILFRDEKEYARNNTRFEICKEVIAKYTSTLIEISAKGDSDIEKAIYLIHFGDWISWYLAHIRNVDSNEVKIIDHLKSELAKR